MKLKICMTISLVNDCQCLMDNCPVIPDSTTTVGEGWPIIGCDVGPMSVSDVGPTSVWCYGGPMLGLCWVLHGSNSGPELAPCW